MNHNDLDARTQAFSPVEMETLILISFGFGIISEKSTDKLPVQITKHLKLTHLPVCWKL